MGAFVIVRGAASGLWIVYKRCGIGLAEGQIPRLLQTLGTHESRWVVLLRRHVIAPHSPTVANRNEEVSVRAKEDCLREGTCLADLIKVDFIGVDPRTVGVRLMVGIGDPAINERLQAL